MTSKYIVGELMGHCGSTLGAVVFPEFVKHSAMANIFIEVKSAGFVEVYGDDVGVRCYGRSESLNKDSVPARDEQLVRSTLGLDY